MKSELIDKIILSLTNIVDDVDIGELKSRLYIAMKGYNISLESTEIVVREENKNEWLVKKFIMTKTVKGLSEKTLKTYGTDIPKILSKIGKSAEDITSDDILYYLAIRECRDKVTKATCGNELRYLSSFFDWLTTEGFVTKNPVKKVGSIKIEKKKRFALSDMEVAKIKNKCNGLKDRAIIEMLLSTGCRVSELVGIKLDDIKDRQIVVKGKGSKERTVYLNASASLCVEEYIKSMAKTINPYLFPKMKPVSKRIKKGVPHAELYRMSQNIEDNGHMSRDSVGQLCQTIGKRAGVENVHPHRFRRTCATMALKRGMPIEYVSKMLGHEELDTTKVYLDLNERDLALAHEKYVL